MLQKYFSTNIFMTKLSSRVIFIFFMKVTRIK